MDDDVKPQSSGMQKRPVLEELNGDLASAKAKVDAWGRGKLSKANDLRDTQKKTVEADKGESVVEGKESR